MLDTWKHRKMHSISKEENSKMMMPYNYERKSFKTINKEDESDKWKDWESQQKIKIIREKRIRWKFCNWDRISQERFGVIWNLSKNIQTHTYKTRKWRTFKKKGYKYIRVFLVTELEFQRSQWMVLRVEFQGGMRISVKIRDVQESLDVDVLWEGECFSD